jgi:hypothetical protein
MLLGPPRPHVSLWKHEGVAARYKNDLMVSLSNHEVGSPSGYFSAPCVSPRMKKRPAAR